MYFDEQLVASLVKQVLNKVDLGSGEPNCAAAGGDWGVFETMSTLLSTCLTMLATSCSSKFITWFPPQIDIA